MRAFTVGGAVVLACLISWPATRSALAQSNNNVRAPYRPAVSPLTSNRPDAAGVTFPSGKSLRPADFYSFGQACAKGTAGQLLDAVLKGSPQTSCMNFGGSMVLYGVRQQNPVGPAVSFWPGKDPESCYQRKLVEMKAQEARSILAAAWDDVVVRCCTQYDGRGRLNGWLMLWNEDGTKQYYRDSSYDCLFQQDQLRSVVERAAGSESRAVHLISDWKIEKTFASTEEAKADSAGQAVLDEIERTIATLRTADSEFRKAHKKVWDFYVGQRRAASSRRISGIIASNAARNASALQSVKGAVKDSQASQSYLWSPGNNYLPVNVSP